jgi:hypothetical protein
MHHLVTLAVVVACALVGLPTAASDPAPAPLATSCQCPTVTCGNGSMSPACQVSCPGNAVCACAYCMAGSRGSSSISGQNSCMCN